MPGIEQSPDASLQRLLALDKSFETLEQRIEEAARILHVDLHTRPTSTSGSKGVSLGITVPNYGRHEFVLRWILEKLRSEPSARNLSQAWSLAWHVVEETSVASCVRVLGPSNALSTVTKALSEIFPRQYVEASLEAGSTQSQQVNGLIEPEQKAGKDKKKSKKRKHAERETDEAVVSSADTDKLEVYTQITNLIRALMIKSSDASDGHSVTLVHQIQATLRLEGEARTQLMKHWLFALVYTAGRSQDGTVSSSRSTFAHIALLLDIWNLQAYTTTAEKDELAQLFCQQCAWPLYLLLSVIRSGLVDHNQEASSTIPVIRQLEQLFAQQVLLPARAASKASHTSTNRSSSSLEEYLQAITSSLPKVQTDPMINMNSSPLLSISQRGLSIIVSIALRATRLDTPRRKQAEMPWLEELLNLIHPHTRSSTLGQTRKSVEAPQFLTNNALEEILDAFLDRKLIISTSALTNIVNRHFILSMNGPDSESALPRISELANFTLLSKIIAIDATLFSSTSLVSGDTSRILFKALSDHAKLQDIDFPASESVMRTLKACRDGIVVPLMHSFARSRNLQQYLTLWHDTVQDSSFKELRWFVWTDDITLSALRDVLEKSLTKEQIRDILRQIGSAIGSGGTVKPTNVSSNETSPYKYFVGSCVVLCGIIGAIRSDDLLEYLRPDLELLLQQLRVVIGDTYPSSIPEEMLGFAWIALTRLNERVLPSKYDSRPGGLDSEHELQGWLSCVEHAKSIPASIAINFDAALQFDHEWSDSSSASLATAPMSYLLSVCEIHRNVPQCAQEIRSMLTGLLIGKMALGQARVYASVLSQYPNVCELFSSTERHEFLKTLVVDTQKASKKVQDVPHTKELQEFISCLIHTCTAPVRTQLTESLLQLLYHEDKLGHELLAQTLLSEWPLYLLSDEQSLHILKWAQGALTNGFKSSSSSQASKSLYLSLILKHVQNKSATIELTNLSKHLWDIAQAIDSDDSALTTDDTNSLLARVGENVYAGLTSIEDSKSVRSSLKDPSKSVVSFAKSVRSGKASLNSARGALAAAFIKVTDAYFKKNSISKKLAHQESDVVDIIVTDLLQSESVEVSTAAISKTLEALEAQCTSPKLFVQTLDAFTTRCKATSDPEENVATLGILVDAYEASRPDALVLAEIVISRLNKQELSPADSTLMSRALKACARLVKMLEEEQTLPMHEALTRCIITVLREKPFLMSQHILELLLASTYRLVSPDSPTMASKAVSSVFLNVCTILQSLLQFHRQSLGGRVHLLLPIITQLLGCLFVPHRGSTSSKIFPTPQWLDASIKPLGAKHARRFARVLTMLCNPPQSTVSGYRSRSRGPELVDETRKLRNYIGQHVQYIMHTLCRMLLHGRLGEGMRDALTPGLWAIIDVMDMGAGDEQRIKVLGASMNKQELALLRREYDGWRKFGAWKGG